MQRLRRAAQSISAEEPAHTANCRCMGFSAGMNSDRATKPTIQTVLLRVQAMIISGVPWDLDDGTGITAATLHWRAG